jgi:acetylornithine/succinyldiaminopimelate/putrescine aminotransferase
MPTHRQLFLQHIAQTSDAPLLTEVERAEGCRMFTTDGREIIDLISGIGVSSVGHRHPKVVAAIQAQLDKYLHLMVYGEFVQGPQALLGQALAATLPNSLSVCYFVNSGSEATEGAMKLAKRFTGRSNFVAAEHAYHGSTQGALSIGGSESFKRNYRPLLPGVQQVAFGSQAAIEAINGYTAAAIFETVQGEAGVKGASAEWWQAVRQKCTDTNTLLILDEIQCGFGRTGSMWAFEQFNIVPDILLTAKAMGGGLPLGAFIARPEIMHVLRKQPVLGHISTFGGHPLSCAASLAALQVLQNEQLVPQVEQKATRIKAQLKHPLIIGIRNIGLMMAVELGSFEINKAVIDHALELGLLTDWFLHCDTALRIAPPLTITNAEIDSACALLLKALNKVQPLNA